MGLSKEDRKSLVHYRLEKAKETFAEIPILTENKLWRNAANRLYYACFYAANALLINDGHQAHTHSEVKTLLSLNYAKENIIDKNLITIYSSIRNSCIYGISHCVCQMQKGKLVLLIIKFLLIIMILLMVLDMY